jgi:rubredoxin
MIEYKYILEPYKGIITRYRCPNCGTNKAFSQYIDLDTGEHISPNVGRCNRESSCGYHYTPKQYFQDNNISFDILQPETFKPRLTTAAQKSFSFIPVEVFKASLKSSAFEMNHFINFLINLFGVEVASQLVSQYFIASSKHWNGSSIFWQIDVQGKVRTGKIMLYSPTTGKRIKEPFNHINWVHSTLKQPEFELRQCLFGEHLLIDKTKPVAIVESEKTAVIASVYLPKFIWTAVGSLTNLNAEKCRILKGRTVVLFPDLNGYEKWSNKAKQLSHLAKFSISDLLEFKANDVERKQGFDLADFLLRFDYKDFIVPEFT